MRMLVIGGAGSGKSEFAEGLCRQLGGSLGYIATMHSEGAEAQDRISRHRALRAGKGFQTFECPRCHTFSALPGKSTMLLECMGTLVANELFASGDAIGGVLERIDRAMDALERNADRLIVVSNDVFSDGKAYPAETRRYLQVLAEANRNLAKRYDSVVEVVCSIPLWHKGGLA